MNRAQARLFAITRFYNNNVYPGTNWASKYFGLSVRCIAGPSESYAIPGHITYNPNGADVIGPMHPQQASDNASVTLYASDFKRDGYGFVGWNTAPDGSGTFFGPHETITTPGNLSTNGLILYAIWVQSAGNLQDASTVASVCSNLTKAKTDGTTTLSSVSALTDTRDGNTYAIAKLADDKCWMIENLRLADKDSNNNDIDLSSSNTNNPSLPLTNEYSTSSTSNHLSPTSTGWCSANSAACDDQSRLRTDNTTNYYMNESSSQSSYIRSYGNYYNWYSATAGNGKYDVNSGNAAGDICPAGWHLPTGGSASEEFGLLDKALGGTGASSSSGTTPTGATMSQAYHTYPNNFVYSGYISSGSSISSRGTNGGYWSSTANGSNNVYSLGFSSSNVDPGTGSFNKYSGRSVRCVANEPKASPGTIKYVANGSSVQGEMGDQIVTNNSSVVLYAPNFKRSGYGFAGWNTEKDGSGTDYGPMETITTPSDVETNGLTLYAKWVQSAGNLQGWNGCDSMNEGDVTALTDTRDNDTYAIAKLADGKCWMIENLRLDDSAILSSANTNNPSLPLTNIYSASTTSNHLSPSSDKSSDYPDGWCGDSSSGACIDQSRLNTDNTTLFTSNTASSYSTTSTVYSYGNYYNWYSATAGNGKYNTTYQNAAGDICPVGWHLPTGDYDGDFESLDNSLGGRGSYHASGTTPTGAEMSSRYRSYPNNFIYPGYYSAPSWDRGTSGNFWSSTAGSEGYANFLTMSNTYEYYGNSYAKDQGRSVRCVANEPKASPGTIMYVANALDVQGEMGDQTVTNDSDVVLYAPNFKRTGYGFAGWNTKKNGTGTDYGPNETIITPSNVETKGLTLYAKWVQSAGNLQGWAGCNDLGYGEVTALTDTRDNDTYAIAKLADGRCWMIENLRLADKDSNNNDIILSSANTNNPLLPLTNASGATSNHLSPTTNPDQTAWCTDSTSGCFDKSMLATNNTTLFTNNNSSNYDPAGNVYSYGNYYNWYSATAGRGTYDFSTKHSNTSGDICPAGWHLPTGGANANKSKSEYWQLSTAIIGSEPANVSTTETSYYTGDPEGVNASKAVRGFPNNFVYSGGINNDGTIVSRSIAENRWSSTVSGNNTAYLIQYSNAVLYPGSGANRKFTGRAIRCVANTISTLDTGQTVNSKLKSLAATVVNGTDTTITPTFDPETEDMGQTSDNYIKSISVHLKSSAPTGFTPSTKNTISSSTSDKPIYIVFENTNDAGIMHFYTEGDQIALSPDSSFMFYSLFALSDLSALSNWNTSSATNMSFMFFFTGYSATTFDFDPSSWDTLNVTNMSAMFSGAGYSANAFTLDLSSWKTSNVTNMYGMFSEAGASATTFSLDLSSWNTSNVTNMSYLFTEAGSLSTSWSISGLSYWNTSSVTDMSYMFAFTGSSASAFSLNLSSWDTSKVTNMDSMFLRTGYLVNSFTLDLSSWNTSSATNMADMFHETGNSASVWSVTIPRANGGGINNATNRLYGQTASTYAAPDSSKSFTLAQP